MSWTHGYCVTNYGNPTCYSFPVQNPVCLATRKCHLMLFLHGLYWSSSVLLLLQCNLWPLLHRPVAILAVVLSIYKSLFVLPLKMSFGAVSVWPVVEQFSVVVIVARIVVSFAWNCGISGCYSFHIQQPICLAPPTTSFGVIRLQFHVKRPQSASGKNPFVWPL